MQTMKKKYGFVVLMDALGASEYSEEKIKKFLSARKYLNAGLANAANSLKKLGPRNAKLSTPVTFTFGDTLIVTCELRSKKHIDAHIVGMMLLIQDYIFNSMEQGILFRGAYSIGSYIDDSQSNTVMGEAITDSASWYEKSDWIGVASTPRTNNILEYYFEDKSSLNNPLFCINYPVPMKDGREIDLYTISWPGRFFQEEPQENPETNFLRILKEQPIPLGTERKYINSRKYFYHVAHLVKTTNASTSE